MMSKASVELSKLLTGLRSSLQDMLLALRSEHYHIPTRITVLGGHSKTHLFQSVANAFLSGEKRVLLVMGDTGSGKTEALLRLSQDLLNKKVDYNSSTYLPIYIDLRRIKNIKGSIIEDHLKTSGSLSYGCILTSEEYKSLEKLMQGPDFYSSMANVISATAKLNKSGSFPSEDRNKLINVLKAMSSMMSNLLHSAIYIMALPENDVIVFFKTIQDANDCIDQLSTLGLGLPNSYYFISSLAYNYSIFFTLILNNEVYSHLNGWGHMKSYLPINIVKE